MNRTNRIIALLLLPLLVGVGLPAAQAQRRVRRERQPPQTRRSPRTTQPRSTPVDTRLTGVYRLNPSASDDPQEAAERAFNDREFEMQQSEIETLTRRLSSPAQLSLERNGTKISIASTRSPRISFNADGRERVERTPRGQEVRTRAVLYGEELMVSYTGGDLNEEFSVTFDPVDNGRRLRVTRRIYDRRLDNPVVVQSVYDKVSAVARWSVYGEPDSTQVAASVESRRSRPRQGNGASRNVPPPTVARNRFPNPPPSVPPPAERREIPFVIGRNTQLIAVLDNNLSTAYTREGDRFTMTVREPGLFAGAILEGYVSGVHRGGRISGRSVMEFTFERVRLLDGRTSDFSGFIEEVRPLGGEQARIDNESGGNIEERDSQTERTVQRTALGAAIGAVIGAVIDGGKGAAIGASIGAVAGAGSVYADGRDDLELMSGTEIIVRAGPGR